MNWFSIDKECPCCGAEILVIETAAPQYRAVKPVARGGDRAFCFECDAELRVHVSDGGLGIHAVVDGAKLIEIAETCPCCWGDDLVLKTDAEQPEAGSGWVAYDGDEVACRECDAHLQICVDRHGVAQVSWNEGTDHNLAVWREEWDQ